MNKFTRSFEVNNFETNINRHLSEVYLLKYFSEMAILHSESIKLTPQNPSNINTGWMINRYTVRIDRLPGLYEDYKISTWISKVDKFYAQREFLLTDLKNNELCRASSLWIYIDLDRRMPIRISQEFKDNFKITNTGFFNKRKKLKKKIESNKMLSYRVRRSDIDSNNHVNNSIYLDWMLELVPSEIYIKYKLSDFFIEYKKETLYGDLVWSKIEIIYDNDGKVLCNHIIKDKELKDIKCLGKTIWEKR